MLKHQGSLSKNNKKNGKIMEEGIHLMKLKCQKKARFQPVKISQFNSKIKILYDLLNLFKAVNCKHELN